MFTAPTAALSFAAASLLAAAGASADTVRVTIAGEVEQNRFVEGPLMGIAAGAPVSVTFELDSTNFVDSTALPGRVRAYPIVGNSFDFTAGEVSVPRDLNFLASFCVRNNDPRADGFFFSTGLEEPTEIPLDLGLATPFGVQFSRTFKIDTPYPQPDTSLNSLDITQATGSWGYDDLSSFMFQIAEGDNNVPVVLLYTHLTIETIPCSGGICPADFDCSGDVSVPDIFAFLSAWFAHQPYADFDHTGEVAVPDIFAYLSTWFAGCGT